jgi:hypothetical protein
LNVTRATSLARSRCIFTCCSYCLSTCSGPPSFAARDARAEDHFVNVLQCPVEYATDSKDAEAPGTRFVPWESVPGTLSSSVVIFDDCSKSSSSPKCFSATHDHHSSALPFRRKLHAIPPEKTKNTFTRVPPSCGRLLLPIRLMLPPIFLKGLPHRTLLSVYCTGLYLYHEHLSS